MTCMSYVTHELLVKNLILNKIIWLFIYLLYRLGLKAVPPMQSKTSLPQTWHVPQRIEGLEPKPVHSLEICKVFFLWFKFICMKDFLVLSTERGGDTTTRLETIIISKFFFHLKITCLHSTPANTGPLNPSLHNYNMSCLGEWWLLLKLRLLM